MTPIETIEAILIQKYGLTGIGIKWRLDSGDASLTFLFHVLYGRLDFEKVLIRSDEPEIHKVIGRADELSVFEQGLIEGFLSRPNLSEIVSQATIEAIDKMQARLSELKDKFSPGRWPDDGDDFLFSHKGNETTREEM